MQEDKSEQVTVIMPGWIAAAIRRWAEKERRSFSGQVVYMVEPVVRMRLMSEQPQDMVCQKCGQEVSSRDIMYDMQHSDWMCRSCYAKQQV